MRLYDPSFAGIEVLGDKKFVRAEFFMMHQINGDMHYFLELSLAYLRLKDKWHSLFPVKEFCDMVADLPLEWIKIPFIACLQPDCFAAKEDKTWIVYHGAPHPYFTQDDYDRYTPLSVLESGYRCSQPLARGLFPFLAQYTYKGYVE